MSEQSNPNAPETNEEKPSVRGELHLIFLSDGSIDFQASCGMMDLWSAAYLCQVKGEEIYVQGMNELRRQEAERQGKDPMRRIVLAQEIPEAKA